MTSKLNAYQLKLVRSHIPLAQKEGLAAWRRAKNPMDKDEVIAIAYQGLITAALNFDPEWRPETEDPNYDPFLAFGSYAKPRIRGTIMDWQRQQDHVPKRQRKIYKDLQKYGHGTGKSPEELASLSGQDVDKIRTIIMAVESRLMLSIDADPEHWNDAPEEDDAAVSNSEVEESATVLTAQSVAADVIASFPTIQRYIVVLRYYEGYDFGRIAMELQISPTTVRTLHQEAIRALHAHIRRAAS